MMRESLSGSDLFNDLAYEFAERYRRGERPPLTEYVERYPELADEIRELFPALVMMERLGGDEGSAPRSWAEGGPRSRGPMPERLGDFRILREVGRGGMGVVYEALQESLGRRVALKVLAPDRVAGPVALLRFRREAQTAALLHHTNIVPVFGVGEHEGISYYAMQYIQGRSLDIVLRELAGLRRDPPRRSAEPDRPALGEGSPLPTRRDADAAAALEGAPPPTGSVGEGRAGRSPTRSRPAPERTELRSHRHIARTVAQAAEALAYGHAHGVVHRDIKPANLLLDEQGTLWISDFGLAKAEGSDELTRPGDVVGTLRYLAPERFAGKADARSDIYSLGMTLYELLALEPAFRASHRASLMHAILHMEPRRPRAIDPRIPRDLETIVLKAIAKDPAHRFAGAGEMAEELSRFAEGLPIRSRRPSIPERLWRWSRRNPAPALLGLLASLLAAALVIGSVAAAWTFREQRDVVSSQQVKTAANLTRALEAERRSEAQRVRSIRMQARDLRLSGRPGRRAEGLRILAEATAITRRVDAAPADRDALRDEAIATLALDDIEHEESRPAPAFSDLRSPAFAVDADRYVGLGGDGGLHVHRLSDRSEIMVIGAGRSEVYHTPVLAASGRFLTAWAGVTGVYKLWDLDRRDIPAAWPRDALAVAYRDDGAQVAVARGGGELGVYDLPAMTESAKVRLGFDPRGWMGSSNLALSGDGRRAAATVRDWAGVAVYDLARGRLVRRVKIPTPRRGYGVLAMDHAGTLLVFAHDRAITVHDVATGETIARFEGHQVTGAMPPAFQPRGHLLATSGLDGRVRLWDPVRGRPIAVLAGQLAGWSGGGSRLAIGMGRRLVIHRIAAAGERRTIDARTFGGRPGEAFDGPARVEYSPDGRLIALPLQPDGVWIVRSPDGVPLAHLPIGHCEEAAFLPGGDLLTYNGWGLCRWPARRLPGGGLRLGPPRPLGRLRGPVSWMSNELAVAASGRLVGAGSQFAPGTMLLDPDRPRRRTWLFPRPPIGDLAISPDGRWAATAVAEPSPAGRNVRVWEASSGRTLAVLDVGPARVAFSPDGRWLGAGGSGRYRFYQTGSWRVVAEVEHGEEGGLMPLAFHPDGRSAAVLADPSRGTARLVEVETGHVLAALEPPDPAMTYAMAFSPDGRSLAMSQTDQRVHLWDLATIRRRLDELGLAEGFPEFSAGAVAHAGTAGPAATTVGHIEVVGADVSGLRRLSIGHVLHETWSNFRMMFDADLDDAEDLDIRGNRWESLGHPGRAAADYRASLARRPDSAPTAHRLARCLLQRNGPGDPDEAVRWARTAVALDPGFALAHLVLGRALYRAGRYAEAAGELEANIWRMPQFAGSNWLLLAMSRHRLGQTAAARAAMAGAARWLAAGLEKDPARLGAFRAELREVQSALAETLPDLPGDVFAH